MVVFFIYAFAVFGIFFAGISLGMKSTLSDAMKTYTPTKIMTEANGVEFVARIMILATIALLFIKFI